MHAALLELVLAGVELAAPLLEDGLGFGERAIALGHPLGAERRVWVEQVALVLGELLLPVGEASLLDAEAIGLLGEHPLARCQLGLGLGELPEPVLQRGGLVRELAGAGVEDGQDLVDGSGEPRRL